MHHWLFTSYCVQLPDVRVPSPPCRRCNRVTSKSLAFYSRLTNEAHDVGFHNSEYKCSAYSNIQNTVQCIHTRLVDICEQHSIYMVIVDECITGIDSNTSDPRAAF